MKTISLLLALVWFGVIAGTAQVIQPKPASGAGTDPTEYRTVQRGPHHKVWERIEYEPAIGGRLVPHRRSYQELATGMHYREGDKWLESEEKIEILPNNAGATAAKGQHKVIFPPEIKAGIIELQMPDGQWLRSRVWGLAYFDSATGQSVLLAEVKESEGQLVGDNVVVYPDAFTDFLVDVRYTYTRAGFEQDVVLREQPPTPEKLGLNPKTTRLQVLTEFVEAVPPAKLEQQADGLADESLGFGVMNIGAGKAFHVDQEGATAGQVPVAKQWGQLEGRDFLIEQVRYEKVVNQLLKLPVANKPKGASLERRGQGEGVLAGLKKLMPKRYVKTTPKPTSKRMARTTLPASPSFVMDYVSLNSTQTNFTFKGDTTYYLSGSFSSFGTNTFEGGTVLKYSTSAALNITPGPPGVGSPVIIWQAGPYRPVVFTAKDDNSVGETISGSTGTPSGYYGNSMLALAAPAATPTLTGLRMAFGKTALQFSGASANIYDAQFVNCQNGISASGATIILGNALFAGTKTNFVFGGSFSVNAQNVTFDAATYVATAPTSPSGNTLAFTNCLFVNVTNQTLGNYYSFNAGYNGFFNSGSTFGYSPTTSATYPLQTVGGGAHYLADSNFRNVGTTNLNAILLASLPKKTTYPPIAYTNITFTSPTTFNPQAQRDTDTPDLGFHYDQLDYAFGGCHANSNLTFTAGTAVGWFRTTSGWQHAGHGIHVGDKQTCSFEGTATAPCYWVRLSRNDSV